MRANKIIGGAITALMLLLVPVLGLSLMGASPSQTEAAVFSDADYQATEQLANYVPTNQPLTLSNWNYTRFRLQLPNLGELGGGLPGIVPTNELLPQIPPCSAFDIGCKLGRFIGSIERAARSFINLLFFFL